MEIISQQNYNCEAINRYLRTVATPQELIEDIDQLILCLINYEYSESMHLFYPIHLHMFELKKALHNVTRESQQEQIRKVQETACKGNQNGDQ